MAPNRSIHDFLPPGDSVWFCPCGRRDTYHKLVAHRKGWRHRPECKGAIRPEDPNLLYGEVVRKQAINDGADKIAEIRQQVLEEAAEKARAAMVAKAEADSRVEDEVEDDTDLLDEDPEELARRLNTMYTAGPNLMDMDSRYLPPIDDGPGADLPEGDWSIEKGPGPLAVSQDRVNLSLPVIHRVMYDWAVNQGWKVGGGSFSEFIDDCLLDYYRYSLGVGLFVAPLEEISENESRTIGTRPTSKGTGADAKA